MAEYTLLRTCVSPSTPVKGKENYIPKRKVFRLHTLMYSAALQARVAQGFKFSKFMDVCRCLGGMPDLPGYKAICIHNLQFSRKCLYMFNSV